MCFIASACRHARRALADDQRELGLALEDATAGASGSTMVSPSPITAFAALWKALICGFSLSVPSSM